MKISLEGAREICAELEKASALCDESLKVVKAREGLGILQVYGGLVGAFLGDSYLNVLAPLWKEFPELEPEAMRKPYEEPTPELSAESQAAIRAFLEAARRAMLQAERTLADPGLQASLPHGGLAEVGRAVEGIAEFLQRPRFRNAVPGEEHET